MNRQIRRIEEKKERKQEREKAKAQAERRARRRARLEERRRAQQARGAGAAEASGGEDGAEARKPRTSDPGRFSGALMIATLFFVGLQAVAPGDGTVMGQVVAASFYLLFGYFAVLWMSRRGVDGPIRVAIGLAAAFAVLTLGSQLLMPTLEPQPVMLALTVPLAVAGAFLGRLVWRNAP